MYENVVKETMVKNQIMTNFDGNMWASSTEGINK